VIQIDFSKSFSHEVFKRIYAEKLADIDISILVNNVGMAYLNDFINLSDEEVH
jgi:short-subunit dehydrogenase